MKKNVSLAVRSNIIIEARYSLSAKENDILDMLLTKIRDDEETRYVLSVDDYRLLYKGDTSNLYRDLKKAVKKIENKGFTIVDKETKVETFYSWFSRIRYLNKQGKIEVDIHPDLSKMLYEVKKKIFYNIEYPLNFESQYSKRLYYYLKSFQDTGWRIDNLDELRKKLECPQSYSNFSFFKRSVLNVAQKDINSTSDISFTYETKKTGKKVTQIKFFIKTQKENSNFKPTIHHNKKTDEFNNYSQRKYNYNKLEEQLTAWQDE